LSGGVPGSRADGSFISFDQKVWFVNFYGLLTDLPVSVSTAGPVPAP
jgi:hypothetical protein